MKSHLLVTNPAAWAICPTRFLLAFAQGEEAGGGVGLAVGRGQELALLLEVRRRRVLHDVRSENLRRRKRERENRTG